MNVKHKRATFVFTLTAIISYAAERRLSQVQLEPTVKCASCREARNNKTACGENHKKRNYEQHNSTVTPGHRMRHMGVTEEYFAI